MLVVLEIITMGLRAISYGHWKRYSVHSTHHSLIVSLPPSKMGSTNTTYPILLSTFLCKYLISLGTLRVHVLAVVHWTQKLPSCVRVVINSRYVESNHGIENSLVS
jgi:hypothetical protein